MDANATLPGTRGPTPPAPGPGPTPQDPGKGNGPRPDWSRLWPYVLLTLVALWFWQSAMSHLAFRTIPYSAFKSYLGGGQVAECAVGQDEITGRIVPAQGRAPGPPATTNPSTPSTLPATTAAIATPAVKEPFLFRTVRVEDPDLVQDLQRAGVRFVGERPSFLSQFLLSWVLPIAVMVGLWFLLARSVRGAGGILAGIGRSRHRLIADHQTGVTFADVAGCDEAKVELQEVVDFLKNKERYGALGAKIPKGVLLAGPPGTGKTLLARAVAGEAGVPFFSISGSDFVEMFVGVGAARVRDLFEQAKQHAPCIVFIDEVDAIGRQRGVHVAGAVNDEREQTLNQLLVEMDGFEANAGVIILAATNRPEILDRALVRPGRFDRQIVVDLPDLDGREAILRVHARGKPLADDADLRRVAAATAGFAGADLANAVNEAALLAARRGSTRIEQRDLDEAVEKVVAGPERRSRRLDEEKKRRVAYHEVGHALAAACCPHADPLHKVSIVPRGRFALGYTLQLPTSDQFLLTQEELRDRIKGLLGGRAAEEVAFGNVSTGAENDLERATGLARQMVCLFGMSGTVGLLHCGRRPGTFLPGDTEGAAPRDVSEEVAREVDAEVKQILHDCYGEVKRLLQVHRDALDRAAGELLRRETLDAATVHRLIGVGRDRAASARSPSPSAP
ncbi:MAG TPA: ATP-dependent zinc metalloprotease FtsH [Tepidisphaeraceae bacterium]|nr:ATP-dependent zinc metalloprotease FtsH [Tepidisphaeraceae bacterium]